MTTARPAPTTLRGLDDPLVVERLAALVDAGRRSVVIVRQTGVPGQLAPSFSVHVCLFVDESTGRWLGDHVGGRPRRLSAGEDGSSTWRWRAFGANAESLLRAVRGSLTVNARQADLALRLREMVAPGAGRQSAEEVSARQEIFDAVRRLNDGEDVRSLPESAHPLPPRRRRSVFTDRPGDVSEIVRRYVDGDSLRRLAADFGVDRAAITRVLLDQDVALRQVARPVFADQDLLASLCARYTAGESVAGLAVAFGCSAKTVRDALHGSGRVAVRRRGAARSR